MAQQLGLPSILSRTVTFLFTEVEDGTRLGEQQPQAIRQALARYDRLLRQAIDSHRGFIFKTVGERFCC